MALPLNNLFTGTWTCLCRLSTSSEHIVDHKSLEVYIQKNEEGDQTAGWICLGVAAGVVLAIMAFMLCKKNPVIQLVPAQNAPNEGLQEMMNLGTVTPAPIVEDDLVEKPQPIHPNAVVVLIEEQDALQNEPEDGAFLNQEDALQIEPEDGAFLNQEDVLQIEPDDGANDHQQVNMADI